MALADLLCIRPGVTALIGSGGKTTLLYALAEELKARSRVIVTTTTHIYVPPHLLCLLSPTAAELRAALEVHPVVCAAAPWKEGKVTAPELSTAELAELADFVLVEADGSRRLPLKAHAPHEPVIPAEANQTICVLGLNGLGRPIQEVCHRPELYAQKLGVTPDTIVTPALAARLLNQEALHDRVFLNQADDKGRKALGRELAANLSTPVCMGALEKGEAICLY